MKRDAISESKLAVLLQKEAFFSAAYCYDFVTSTNDVAKELAKNGALQGTVVLSDGQTQGRGRTGRRFHSPDGTGLYMSLILRPERHQQDAGLLTACGAVAVHQAIFELTGVQADIKWVNDLLYQGRKLCGILAESQFASDGTFSHVILGIGVNLVPPEGGYADEIKEVATSLAEICGNVPDKLVLCAAILRHWFRFYDAMPCVDFLQTYRDCSCVLGKSVSYIKNGISFIGKAVSIDERARLIIEVENEKNEILETGEIAMVRPVL